MDKGIEWQQCHKEWEGRIGNYSGIVLFIHSISTYLFLLTPNIHSIPINAPHSNHKSVLYVCEFVSDVQISIFVSYFRFTM